MDEAGHRVAADLAAALQPQRHVEALVAVWGGGPRLRGLQEHGYTTGGIVSNINLAESFGFDQGYDEYHYLGPDYLAGAEESSSKLILYQLVRSGRLQA